MDLSTHFYLFMTIMCLVLTSAKSCNADSLHMDDTVAEKLPEPNESRNLLSTTSHLIDTDETESKRPSQCSLSKSILQCTNITILIIFTFDLFFFSPIKVQEPLAE